MFVLSNIQTASLPAFLVTFYDEDSKEIFNDMVHAPNCESAMGIAATDRQEQPNLVLINVINSHGGTSIPGDHGITVGTIKEQQKFSFGISQQMINHMVNSVNYCIEERTLVDRAVNPDADSDEENVYTIYAMLSNNAEELNEKFTISEDAFVELFTAAYRGYKFMNYTHNLSVSFNFAIDSTIEDEHDNGLSGLTTDQLRYHLIEMIENESDDELRSRLEVFDSSELDF